MARRILALVAVSTLLTATGCSGAQDNSEPVTLTSTVTEQASSEPNDDQSDSNADEAVPESNPELTQAPNPAPSPAPAPSPSPAPAPAPAGNHNINVGQVGGDCGTTSQGDSITAKSATSCEFAAAVFDAAMAATWEVRETNPTVTAVPHSTVTAFSPVTGQAYTVDCTIGSDRSTLTCMQQGHGNNAEVGAIFSNSGSNRIGNRVNIVS